MALDIAKIFNEQLPAILAKNSEEAKSINATYQMNITGAGSWFLDLTSAGPKIEPGEQRPRSLQTSPPPQEAPFAEQSAVHLLC